MSYNRKIDKEAYEINITATDDGENFWIKVSTKSPYASASKIIRYPNFLEQLFGVTAENKLERAKNDLFKKVREELAGADGRVIAAINKFVEENDK